MSRNDWERGEFKLPSAEFATFRKAMQDVDRARKEKAFAITQDFWKTLKGKQKTDRAAYMQALQEWQNKHYVEQDLARSRYSYRQPDPIDESAREMAHGLLYAKGSEYFLGEGGRSQHDPNRKPTRVLASDVAYPTNRTTHFEDGECSVSFDKDKKTVYWTTGHNSRAVERAHDTPLGRAFFKHLNQVRWTHGTGGVMTGNDEYNRDTTYEGGGANYVTGAYGYIGIAESPWHARDFVNAKGEQITCEVKTGKYGGFVGKPVKGVNRVARGVPAGGQFSTRGRGESGIRL